MMTKLIPLLALMLAFSGSFSFADEATTNVDYAAVEKSAQEAEAVAVPLKDALLKAEAAYASAMDAASAKRQRAVEAKNLSGEPGVIALKQAESNVAVAARAVTDATDTQDTADDALDDAKDAAIRAQKAGVAADKAMKEADAEASEFAEEAKKASADCDAKRKAATDAAATNTSAAAEKAAQKAAKESVRINQKSQQAAAQAAAKRTAADAARATLAQMQQKQQEAQNQANVATQKLAVAVAQKSAAKEALANIKMRISAAKKSCAADEEAARVAEAATAPLQAEVDKARTVYLAAKNIADDKRATANQIKAEASYEAARKTARDAEAAVAPLKDAMQKADVAYANASKEATTKRQQATDTKNLSGDPGVADLKKAEDEVPAASKALTDATNAKPPLDKALADAKAVALPLQQAYDAAEKAAKEAEIAAKAATEAANKLDDEAKKATTQATARRRAADAAKAAMARAQQGEQNSQNQANAAAAKLAEIEAQKKAADDALNTARNQVSAVTTAHQSAEQAAQAAEAESKTVSADAAKSPEEKKKVADDAAARRKAANDASVAMTQAQANLPNLEKLANVASQKLTRATAQKNMADAAMANAKNQVVATTTASQTAELAAQAAEKAAEEKNAAVTQAAARRKAAVDAAAALAQAQQNEQQCQIPANASAKAVTDATAQKKTADDALASARGQVAAATVTYNIHAGCADFAEALARPVSEAERQQAVADAAARRKVADEAKPALTKAQQDEQQAQAQVAAADQKLTNAPAQKKAADDALASAKNQVASATSTSEAAEKAAQEAEAAAKAISGDAAKSPEEKKNAADAAAAKRKTVVDAAVVLAQAKQSEQQAQAQVDTAAKNLADVPAQKKAADDALANARNQVAAAMKAFQVVEQPALGAEATAKAMTDRIGRSEEQKQQAANDAAAKRKVADASKAVLTQAQQSEQQALAQANAAAQKLAEADAQKKAADTALANARNQLTAATAANQAAQDAAKEVIQHDATSKQATADAAAKRKAANEAKVALDPKAKIQDEAAVKANTAAQELTRAEARKKSADEGLENLKKRIASAKQTFEADEKAAQTAEAAAAPLKVEAEKTRAAYTDAMKVADDKRTLVEQAKSELYRLVAAKQVAKLMESPEPPKPANRIDEIVFAKLKALNIQPVLCSDSVFIRRAYLDLTGTLPSAEEARTFIQSPDKNKRIALIDHLLDLSKHADYWAMRWSDILKVKAEFPVKVWPNAAQAYHRWIWESIARNKPYDQFVRELLTSSGSNFRVGPVNFYRAIQEKTPVGIAAAVGLSVMGTRVLLWPQDRRTNMEVFFSQLGYKPTSEWKEEIVFWDPLKSVKVPGDIAPGVDSVAKAVTATAVIPQALTNLLTEPGPIAAEFPDGTKTTIPPDRDPRDVFADWLIRPENPWFAKAIVNRTWAWVMGRGIIHEPDNIRDDNPPSNPDLLACLEKEFVASHYDLKQLKRLILTSTTYQFSSIPRVQTPEARASFASYPMRRVEAEVLIDALNNITGGSDLYTSAVPEPFTYIPKDMSAVELADGSVTSPFLTLFGRSSRSTGMEAERVSELASIQWLHMLNSAAIQGKLQSGPKLAAILSSGGKPNEIAEKLCLTILSRFPTEADIKSVEDYSKAGATKGNDVWFDLAWAFINSPEFLLRH